MDGTLYQGQQLHPPSLYPQPPQHHSLVPEQIDFDPSDPFPFHAPLDGPSGLQQLHPRNFFDPSLSQPTFPPLPLHAPRIPQPPTHVNNGVGVGQFGVLTPHPQLPDHPHENPDDISHYQNSLDLRSAPNGNNEASKGRFGDLKLIPHPPNLDAWRQRLFDLTEPVTLTEDEFNTYYPHIDNIYSHRSTQPTKRKPLISHYFDCRLKGRPPGTKPSEDPTKPKRKRRARERDLCDVKIKITEYFPGPGQILGEELTQSKTPLSLEGEIISPNNAGPGFTGGSRSRCQSMHDPGLDALRADPSGSDGARFYTIQRVNGNGQNGKGDGLAATHQHTLEESDRIKKSSVYRHFLKEEKDSRRTLKSYHKKATGAALATAKRRTKEHELKLFGSCFCPFVQRVWISLELKRLDYQYIEIDPYHKADWFLELNPRGLVPALRHGDWTCYESTVLMEYLEDLNTGPALLPSDPRSRANSRLWSDHVNRHVIPNFYRYLQAQDTAEQTKHATTLSDEIKKLVDAAHPQGPFFLGPQISFVDVQIAPWVLRMKRVLAPYRGWPQPEPGSRWGRWVEAIEGDESVKATTSADDLYRDSYERYAQNRPDTSQVARAVNEGHGLP